MKADLIVQVPSNLYDYIFTRLWRSLKEGNFLKVMGL